MQKVYLLQIDPTFLLNHKMKMKQLHLIGKTKKNENQRIVIHFLVFTNGHYFGVVVLLNKVRICGSKN
jgi:hypothetical protein